MSSDKKEKEYSLRIAMSLNNENKYVWHYLERYQIFFFGVGKKEQKEAHKKCRNFSDKEAWNF